MYNGNIYIPDKANSEFYNYQNQTWTFWPNLPLDLGFVSCNILWRDSFVLAGGSSITYGILKFNFTTNKWTILKNMTEDVLSISIKSLTGLVNQNKAGMN